MVLVAIPSGDISPPDHDSLHEKREATAATPVRVWGPAQSGSSEGGPGHPRDKDWQVNRICGEKKFLNQ